eukprot:1154873-Pelagomonas_calceolata.AAC.1
MSMRFFTTTELNKVLKVREQGLAALAPAGAAISLGGLHCRCHCSVDGGIWVASSKGPPASC